MSYRDLRGALEERRAALHAERAEIERTVDSAERALDEIEVELCEIAQRTGPRSIRVLPSLRVASPCDARWEDMVGDGTVRVCKRCFKHVYNLSAMSPDEAQALVDQREEAPCVRFYRRADGTIRASDCAVGKQRRIRIRTFTALALVACVAPIVVGSCTAHEIQPVSSWTSGGVAAAAEPAGANASPGDWVMGELGRVATPDPTRGRANVVISDLDVFGPARSPEPHIRRLYPGIVLCYARTLSDVPQAEGTIRARVRVDRSGRASNVELTKLGRIPSSLEACIRSRIQRVEVEPESRASTLTFQLTLNRGS